MDDEQRPRGKAPRRRRRPRRFAKKWWAAFGTFAAVVVLLATFQDAAARLLDDVGDVAHFVGHIAAFVGLGDGGGGSEGGGKGGGASTDAGQGTTRSPFVDSGGGAVRLRASPTLDARVLASLPDDTPVTILCTVQGMALVGYLGPSSIWDRLRADGKVGYVNDSLIYTGTAEATKRGCPRL
jgi:hypothetical protein